MDKIGEARELLKMLGMPKAQQADICCYVVGAANDIMEKFRSEKGMPNDSGE